MVRAQIQLTEEQLKRLRRLSAETGRSIAQIIREGVDLYLRQSPEHDIDERQARALNVVGKFASGYHDVSVNHDKHLAEAFEE